MSLISVRTVVATARELMPAGPVPVPADARSLIAELRGSADTAVDLVLDVMRLDPAAEDAARARLGAGRAVVVDRLGWVRANARTFASLLDSLPADESGNDDSATGGSGTGRSRAALAGLRGASARTAASVELGTALAFVGPRVLGQYDPFHPDGGVLHLVAPNVLAVEAAIGARPRDFRLWVALHEQTHRVQFAAAPWLAGHMRALIDELLVPLAGTSSGGLLQTLRAVPEAIRDGGSLLDILAGPEQTAAIERIGALMSLLEGHADVVMDAVGPRVIPTVAAIRRSFDSRRRDATGARALVSGLLGVDEKLAQYERGARFVRFVVRRRGHSGLAAVWRAPETLPTGEEIADPALWLARVEG